MRLRPHRWVRSRSVHGAGQPSSVRVNSDGATNWYRPASNGSEQATSSDWFAVLCLPLNRRWSLYPSLPKEARGAVNQKGGLRRLSENVGRLCLNWQPGAVQWRFLRVLRIGEVGDIAPIRAVMANSQFTERERRS